MNKLALNHPFLKPCPIELLVRHEFGAAFDRFVRSHDTVRLVPGIYVDSQHWQSLAAWDKYLSRVHAVSKQHPDTIFIYESAAALIGLPFVGSPRYVHVLVDHRGAARRRGIVQGHFITDNLSTEKADGITTTSVTDTAVSIARARHPAFGLAALDQTIRRFDVTAGELAAVNESRSSDRGATTAEWAIDRATGIPESVLESLSNAEIEWLGFETPQLQKEFALGTLGTSRVDTYWPSVNVVGEADGDSKYQMHAKGVGGALLAEKRREDALRRITDGFARWGWADCRDPNQLDRILFEQGVPRVRQRIDAPLRTLKVFLGPR